MPTSSFLLALPVVDLDGTLLVQAGLFLLMVVLLNGLLFKPWLELQARRKDSISGALERAEQLQLEASTRAGEYDKALRDARENAQLHRSDSRKLSEREGAERLSAARDAAREQLEQARARIGRDADLARTALAARVDELARDIVGKILGRAA